MFKTAHHLNENRSQWPSGLRRRSAAARLLGLWVRIPPGAWTFVCCECCVLLGRGLGDELITRPEGVLPTVMRRCVWSTNLAIPNHLCLRLNRRCITGCISYMPLIVTVKTIAECLRADCNILGDNKKNKWIHSTYSYPVFQDPVQYFPQSMPRFSKLSHSLTFATKAISLLLPYFPLAPSIAFPLIWSL